MTEFPVKAGNGQPVRARILETKNGFAARYDLDRINDVFSRPGHTLAGQSRAVPDGTMTEVDPESVHPCLRILPE